MLFYQLKHTKINLLKCKDMDFITKIGIMYHLHNDNIVNNSAFYNEINKEKIAM